MIDNIWRGNDIYEKYRVFKYKYGEREGTLLSINVIYVDLVPTHIDSYIYTKEREEILRIIS